MHYKRSITIFDINFILLIIGFVFFTTFLPFVDSVTIRFIGLLISSICLFKSGFKIIVNNNSVNAYLFLLIIIVLRTTVDVFIGDLSDAPYEGKLLVLSYQYGVMLIPLLSVISSYQKINWLKCLFYIQLILFVVILMGVLNSDDASNINSNGRIGLNDRQGTLQFATNSSYLLILSLVLFMKSPLSVGPIRNIYKFICLLGIVLAFWGFSKSGSRGSFLASFVVVLFFIYNITNNFKYWLLLIGGLVYAFSVSILSFAKNFAPVLFSRLAVTLEEGDEARQILFDSGMEKLRDSPFWGDNPLIIWDGGFCGLHNMYLDVVLFLGIIGFSVFIYLYLSLLLKLLTNKTRMPIALFFNMLFILFVVKGFTGLTIINDPLISLSFIMSCICIKK